MQKAFYLENVLKNETLRQIVRIREIKTSNSIKDAVVQIRQQKAREANDLQNAVNANEPHLNNIDEEYEESNLGELNR